MKDHREYRDPRDELGKHVLTLRTRAALTQSALAEHVGVHRRSVQNWETGVSYPKTEMVQCLIEVFLSQHTFTPDHEREEAQALWRQAAPDGSHAISTFDEIWFDRILALHIPVLAEPAPKPAMIRALIDLGRGDGRPDAVWS